MGFEVGFQNLRFSLISQRADFQNFHIPILGCSCKPSIVFGGRFIIIIVVDYHSSLVLIALDNVLWIYNVESV